MPAPCARIGGQGPRDGPRFECLCEGGGIEQSHVCPLPQLRGGAVGGVSDVDEAILKGTVESAVAVAGHRHLI